MEKHLYQKYIEIESGHWWFVGRRKIISDIFDKYGIKSENAKILDFGCNHGFFAGILQKQGFNVSGIDVSPEAIFDGREAGVKNLHTVLANLSDFPEEKFNVILCLDVLEHIENDKIAFEKMKKALLPGGLIIITVPAFQFLWGVQDEASNHFRRYNKKTFKELLRKDDLQNLRFSYFNFILFPAIAFVRILAKIKKPKRVSDFEMGNRLINSLLKGIFLFEVWLFKFMNFPIGVSLLAVLKKQEV
jgi:SAM-dependent methyltransferase